jgi:hypothetical protein
VTTWERRTRRRGIESREAEKRRKRDGRIGSRWWEYGRKGGGEGERERGKKRREEREMGEHGEGDVNMGKEKEEEGREAEKRRKRDGRIRVEAR